MFDRNKPLFSRPVLAAIMVLSTLGIWFLNLIYSNTALPAPNVVSWKTTSGIPVNWVNMEDWQNGNKVIIKFVFESKHTNSQLTEATFDLLMGDSLPLSRSTINQRLAPLSAKAESYITPLQQTLQLTLNSESNYLPPSLSVIKTWLQQATFKPRSLVNWQQRHRELGNEEQRLLDMLLVNDGTKTKQVSLENINAHYQSIQHSTSHISIVGHLDDTSKQRIDVFLDSLSESFQPMTVNAKAIDEREAREENSSGFQTHSHHVMNEGTLHESHSILSVKPPQSVEDWATYLIWARDSVATANQNPHINFMQWHLSLTTAPSYVWWSQQYQPPLENTTQNDDIAPAPDQWKQYNTLPSYTDEKQFILLKEQLLMQLESRTLTPDWWAYISTQITTPTSSLTLETFIETYSDALNSFTIENYKDHLAKLIYLDRYQDIQVNQ
ncbi:hypothetical protein [Marinomonas mediterranea]|jgi:hypothetical protein|uniref:Peptidase M16 domain protein n=1 Tax=Marinomonas mediterranea (strain ATCC 700492 / JCM 21426 / NBRC 103028 / MMB-1) TaxID=717774 RepID=F2K020_MARM1|nr:hypothetical protein [Marinomonas mediterranea]ADZ93234.1 hypothetical protein Marme_4026 [Marinomonas mediterranea MMB-1]WCN19229.1 hypothetical protein GV053_20385 [Marinomonas mediterranea MMB-1]